MDTDQEEENPLPSYGAWQRVRDTNSVTEKTRLHNPNFKTRYVRDLLEVPDYVYYNEKKIIFEVVITIDVKDGVLEYKEIQINLIMSCWNKYNMLNISMGGIEHPIKPSTIYLTLDGII